MGNLLQVTEPAPGGGTHETYYAYNILNQMTSVTMPRSTGTQTRTFNYDPATFRLSSTTNPENGTVSYTYNPDGSVATKTDARNTTIAYTYDQYGRLTTDGEKNYYYDTNPFDPYYSANGWGKLVAVQWAVPDLTFTEIYGYSQGGAQTAKRLRTQYSENQWGDLDATFAYDNEGHYMGPATYPGDSAAYYTYPQDTLGRPTAVHVTTGGWWSTNFVANAVYAASGELSQMSLPDGLTETRAFNTLGQMTRLTVRQGANPPVEDLEYRYPTSQNNNGRIAQMKDWVTGEEVNYTYDSLTRLTQAATTGPEYGLNYTYDGFGNLTSQVLFKGSGPTTYLSYNAQTNRIATAGYQYDAAGNLTATPNVNLSYDNQSRLNAASNWNNGYETYGYDPRNQRLWVRGPDQVNDDGQLERRRWDLTLYGPDGQKVSLCHAMWYYGAYSAGCDSQEVRFGGKLTRTQSVPWVDGSGALIFDSATSHLPDRLSSEGRHYPYGELRPGSPDGDFATYPHDTTITGFHYANQRYYASQIARFTTPDPYKASAQAANPQSWNRYAYVENDPVNYNDPRGLWKSIGSPPPDPSQGFYGDRNALGGDWSAPLIDAGNTEANPSPPIVDGSSPGEDDSVLHVGNPAKSGEKYDQLLMAFARTLAVLDSNCEAYLNSGGGNVRSYVSDLIANDLVAVGSFDPRTAAFTNATGTDLPDGFAAMVFNTSSAFYQGTTGDGNSLSVNNGRIPGGTAAAQIFIILHELAHGVSTAGYENDYNNPSAGKRNDNRINSNCGGTLGAVP